MKLTRMLHLDTAGVIKRALWELYEDPQDQAKIATYEARERAGEVSFSPIDG